VGAAFLVLIGRPQFSHWFKQTKKFKERWVRIGIPRIDMEFLRLYNAKSERAPGGICKSLSGVKTAQCITARDKACNSALPGIRISTSSEIDSRKHLESHKVTKWC
jgi:hypothetical protein